VTDVFPPNVTVRLVPGSSCDPSRTTPTLTAPTWSGADPKVLLSRTRRALPPTLVKMTFRTVWSEKLVLPAIGLAPHDATQLDGPEARPAAAVV
jgi:hypothetical protein